MEHNKHASPDWLAIKKLACTNKDDKLLLDSLIIIAQEWAKKMEAGLAKGKNIGEIAANSHAEATRRLKQLHLKTKDCDLMVGYLVHYWVHGNKLNAWYKNL